MAGAIGFGLAFSGDARFYSKVQEQVEQQNEEIYDQHVRLTQAIDAMTRAVDALNVTMESVNEQRVLDKMNIRVFYDDLRRGDSLTNKRLDFLASRVADNRRDIDALKEGKPAPRAKVMLREWVKDDGAAKPEQPPRGEPDTPKGLLNKEEQ
jgi:RecA/RadA recombinase